MNNVLSDAIHCYVNCFSRKPKFKLQLKIFQQLISQIFQVAKGTELSNEIFLIVAATIYYHEENYEAALK